MNALVKSEGGTTRVPVLAPSGMFSDPEKFEFAQRVAHVFANSNLVPVHLKGKLPDCLIALHMAERLGEDPLTTMQNIMVVNGRPGFMTSYMIARTNRSGIFKGPITWSTTGAGDTLSVTAMATLAVGGDTVSATADMAMAVAEGWTKNAKYKSMPAHMLSFRSAAMLIRLYCPEVMLGMNTVEELEVPSVDARPLPSRVRPPDPVTVDAVVVEAPRPPAPTPSKPPPPPTEKAKPATVVDEFTAACAAAKTDDDLSEIMGDFQAALEIATADEREAMHRAYEIASQRVAAQTSTLAAG